MEPSFHLNNALSYIRDLSGPDIALKITAQNLIGENIQPTIGTDAAALLDVIVRAMQPQRILEIGTSYGYATAVLGKAAASYGGSVLSIEINPRLAEAAKENILALGLQSTVEILTADAKDAARGFDILFGLILQDGHKLDYLSLLEPLITRLEPRGLLISDDVLFPVMDIPAPVRDWQMAMNDYNHALKNHSCLQTAWLPVGDGMAISVKISSHNR
jgi:predicted O-methyltransferase YrrM